MPATPTRAAGIDSKANMEAILQNIQSLAATARQGRLPPASRVMLRKSIHDHHRYIIAYAFKKDRPNPLLDLPEILNPSIPGEGKCVALVSPEGWDEMVMKADTELRQKYTEGNLDPLEYLDSEGVTSGTSRAGTPVAAAVAGNLRQQLRSAASGTGTSVGTVGGSSAAPSPGTSAAPSPATSTQTAPPPMVSTPTPIAPAPAAAVVPAPAAPVTTNNKAPTSHLPPGIMSGVDMRRWVGMTRADRDALLQSDPDMKQRFEISLAYYRTNQAKAAAKTAGNTAKPGTPQPLSQAPAATAGQATSINPNPSGSNKSQQPTLPVLGNPNFTLSQPPPPRSQAQAGPSGTSNASGEAGGSNPSTQITASSSAQNLGAGSVLQPMSASGVEQQFGGYVPPPRREESELDKRKRKYKEWVEEMGTGLEMETGVAEILNDVIDRFVTEVTRGGIRLSKHRNSPKVEVKDLALYLDQCYHMTVPGFDAIIPRRPHIPPDTEDRKRLRTVIPRLTRRAAADTGAGKGTITAIATATGGAGQAEAVPQVTDGSGAGADGAGGLAV